MAISGNTPRDMEKILTRVISENGSFKELSQKTIKKTNRRTK